MYITKESIYNYIFVNTFLVFGGVFDWYIYNSWILLFTSILWKHILILYMVYSKNSYKPYINLGKREIHVVKEIGYILQSTCVEFISLQLLLKNSIEVSSFGWEVIVFIPKSFIFELMFDLGHYITHRIAHSIPWIYMTIHKEHHQHILINPLTTYHQDGIDLLFTNTLPLLFASCIIPTSRLFVCIMMWYKTILEVGGHLGKVTKANSFPQCIWLPRWLSIELKSEDHNYHHRNPLKNFSKRFSIWDKVFGTFSAGSEKKYTEEE